MIIIDYRDSRPIYEQVVDKFRLLILNGALKADDKMPSVRTLAMELSINPNTIQRAYGELERQGYIYTVKGRGNFVSGGHSLKDDYRDEVLGKLDEIYDMAMNAGIRGEELIEHIHNLMSRKSAEATVDKSHAYSSIGDKNEEVRDK